MKKTPLSLEDHAAQGRELKFIRDWLTSLSVKLGNAYPLKLHNLANRATVAVDKLRSALDDRVGLDLPDAARLANHAGGIVVMKKGAAVVTPLELKQAVIAPS